MALTIMLTIVDSAILFAWLLFNIGLALGVVETENAPPQKLFHKIWLYVMSLTALTATMLFMVGAFA